MSGLETARRAVLDAAQGDDMTVLEAACRAFLDAVQAQRDAELVPVYLANATMTSTGKAGPGSMMLPRAEAARLIAGRIAASGGKPGAWSGAP